MTLTAATAVNDGDTAWVLVCAALVLFMVPGLAMFYAGMVRSRNALTMMQQNIIPIAVVSVLWALVGYSIAYSRDAAGFVGDLERFGLGHLGVTAAPALHLVAPGVTIPALAFVAYQMMFAIITPALISGATAARLKAAGWVVFVAIWSVVVYAPIVHWLWGPSGWLATLGAQDWAGGIVVHTSAGAAVVAMLLVVGRRTNWPDGGTLPHSVPLTIAGAGILWFGWFGFNAGDGLQANGIAAQAFINTQLAAAAGVLLWLFMEHRRHGRATVLGAVTGAVAGLATITPCAGYVSAYSALLIGAIAGLVCHIALRVKRIVKLDDALDVIAVHFVGGALGSLLVGFFAEKSVNPVSANGVFYGGGKLLGDQVIAVICVAAFSFALTWIIATGIQKTIGLRVAPGNEARLDQVQQGMDAYHFEHVWNLPGSAAAPHPAPLVPVPVLARPDDLGTARPGVTGPVEQDSRELAAAQPAADVRLVAALVDPYDVDSRQMISDLLQAGGSSIVISEVNLYTGDDTQVVRSQTKPVDFPDRLRVEVLVPSPQLEGVLQVLRRSTRDATTGQYIKVVRPEMVIVNQLSPRHPRGQ